MQFVASYTDEFGATDEFHFSYETTGLLGDATPADTRGIARALEQRFGNAVTDDANEEVAFRVIKCLHLGGHTWVFIVVCPGWVATGFIKKAK